MKAETAQAARCKLQLSHAEMAKLLGVGLRTLFRWEAEGVPPGPARVVYRLILNGAVSLRDLGAPGGPVSA